MPSDRPVLPPLPADATSGGKADKPSLSERMRAKAETVKPASKPASTKPVAARPAAPRTRTAHLRLTRIDPLSVMKMAFLLSIALGIVMVVAVTIVWSVLSAVGVWDNINSAVQQVIGTEQGETFDVSEYIGTPRVIGFALIASVINVVLLTAIATLSAFVYNLAAALLGGVEMTWAEDR